MKITIAKLVEFLLEQDDQDLELSILMPDCGGYDVETVPLEEPVIVSRTAQMGFYEEDVCFLADKSIKDIWDEDIIEIIS